MWRKKIQHIAPTKDKNRPPKNWYDKHEVMVCDFYNNYYS